MTRPRPLQDLLPDTCSLDSRVACITIFRMSNTLNLCTKYETAHFVQLAKSPKATLYPSLPSVKTEGENCHEIDVNVYLGKQREEGIGMLVILRNFPLLSAPRQKFLVCKSTTVKYMKCIPSIRDTSPNCPPIQVKIGILRGWRRERGLQSFFKCNHQLVSFTTPQYCRGFGDETSHQQE